MRRVLFGLLALLVFGLMACSSATEQPQVREFQVIREERVTGVGRLTAVWHTPTQTCWLAYQHVASRLGGLSQAPAELCAPRGY